MAAPLRRAVRQDARREGEFGRSEAFGGESERHRGAPRWKRRGAPLYAARVQIIVDTREQTPWTFEGQAVTTKRAKLAAGDYSVAGYETRIAIERKSLDDWTGTVIRDRARFYRELELLRSYPFRAVIVEAGVREILSGSYRSSAAPAAILGFVAEVTVAQDVPVYLAGSRAEAQLLAGVLLRMAAAKIADGTIVAPSSRTSSASTAAPELERSPAELLAEKTTRRRATG